MTKVQQVSLYFIDIIAAHSYNGAPKKLGLKLPLFITKFIQGTSMNSQDFFKRWKQLGNEPSQEMQKIFPGKFPSNSASVKESVSLVCVCSVVCVCVVCVCVVCVRVVFFVFLCTYVHVWYCA